MSQYNKAKILIVDDDPSIADMVMMILEISGFAPIIADCQKVLETVKKEHIDLVLLDIWLSGVDGREISNQIKNDPSLQHIPVILLSASKGMADSASKARAQDYLEKPFEMDELIGKIEHLLLKAKNPLAVSTQ